MNPKLQKILDIIQQKGNLSDEEKESALKTLKDADKELEITSFKLERTEKVKKTTAILLEETIEELEQKRKSVEDKNRELEIESSLERVRTVAMSMNESDDLLKICEITFKEFQKLGFDNLRNAIIHILDDEKEFFMDYDYSDYLGGSINSINYDSHPIVENYLKQIKKADDAFAGVVIEGNELNGWKEFRRKGGQLDDPKLEETSSLHYYLYSIGVGDIGISTFKPIDESQIKILKRFRNVFDLAYKRYNDITLAEAQAREARIETALERVRAVAMAMHNSEDLAITIDHFFKELKKLNVKPIRTGVGIKDGNSRIVDVTVTSATENGEDIKLTGKLSLGGHPILDKVYEALQLQKEYFPVLHGEEINEYYKAMNPDIEFPNFSKDDVQYGYYFHFEEGGIFAWTEKELLEEDINIFRRFKSVLSLTYRRFLDLQNAEAQAREAQIEAALERVRSKTMAMHNSNDVGDTVVTLFKEVMKLGLDPTIRCGIGILEGYDGMETRSATSFPNGEVDLKIGMLDMTIHPMLIGLKKAWENGETGYSYEYIGDDVIRYYKALNNEPEYPFYVELDTLPEKEYHNSFFFKEGILFSFTGNPLSEESSKVLNRFASVFGQTYRRYLDLKKAEAQARESQIEAALERVRSRSMAMRKSEELADLSFELVRQVHALGIDTWFCAFNIYDDDPKGSLEWGSNAQGTYEEYRTPREGIFLRYYNAGQKGETLLINEIDEDECPSHYKYLCTLPGVGEQLLQMKDAGIPFPSSQIDHVAYFKYGYIIFITFEPAPDAHDIFKRFARVFEQTYTRFLDLQNAEAQNKIIQAENERKTKELEEARQLQLSMLPKELPKLPNLDIAVYMQTATEVGGDYYDFKVGIDGTLTSMIGDATGHGMKAGTVVTITKSLFNSMAASDNILGTFEKISEVIKGMKFRQLAMCLLMLKIRGNRFSISSAAMPPALIYRAGNDFVEEIMLKGMPLGTMKNFPYKKIEGQLNRGDTILLYSDGFPELSNEGNELFGYERTIKEFQSVGEKEPEEIISHLKNLASQWVNGNAPDDDVTFVVIKVK